MKAMKSLFGLVAAVLLVSSFSACDNDDTYIWYYDAVPNALVTVKPVDGDGFYMQLDDSTTLHPVNMSVSPYGDKEVRALVNYAYVRSDENDYEKRSFKVNVNWIDSILTKPAVPYPADGDVSEYGEDPIEIVRDWVNIAEDGYLTLRFRTRWGNNGVVHFVNLLTGVNPGDPYEVEFRHNAYGDVNGTPGDALVAFRLSGLPDTNGKTVKLTLKYKSFSGEKSIRFDYCSRKATAAEATFERALCSPLVK